MSLKDFEYVKELGKGAFASVCLVKRKSDGCLYAMKRVKISSLSSKERENALNEVRILASIQHPNLIGFKECFYDEESKSLNIIMEFADDGDVENKIKGLNRCKGQIPEEEIWSYLIQILTGLKSLHEKNIMHRDLKSANLFLTKDKKIKLGDLNVSKLIKKGMNHTQTGTPYYASPEVWADKPYDQKSDIWSVGCIIYEMCCLIPPFRAKSLEGLYKCVTKGLYDPIPNTFSKCLEKVISQMLQINPDKRPSCTDLLKLNELKDRIRTNPSLFYLNIEDKDFRPQFNEINEKTFGIVNYKSIKDIKESLPKKKNYSLEE